MQRPLTRAVCPLQPAPVSISAEDTFTVTTVQGLIVQDDLAALRAADIGFAVGATDATVPASLSTPQTFVAGVSSDTLLQ